MAKDVVERVVETARAVEAGHARDRSETTYVVFALENADQWVRLGVIGVPQRTHRRSLLAKAQEQLNSLDDMDDGTLMFVPSEFATPMPVKRPDAARQPLEIA